MADLQHFIIPIYPFNSTFYLRNLEIKGMVYDPHLISLKINDLSNPEMIELRDLFGCSILGRFYFFPTKDYKMQKELIAGKQVDHRTGASQSNGFGLNLNHGISFELRKCGLLNKGLFKS